MNLTLQNGLFRGYSKVDCSISHTYPAMMKLGTVIPYIKRSKRYVNHVTHPLSSTDIRKFSPKISKFCYIKNYMYRLLFYIKFIKLFWVFKGCLNKKVTILMMSAKMTTPGLLKIKLFWNKGDDIIIYVHDVTNKFLSRESNYIVDMVRWPKFGISIFLWE